MLWDVANVHAVHCDAAGRYVVKTGNEIDKRGFAAAGGADEGRCLAGPGRKGYMLQHIFVRALIVEGDVVELHKPFHFFRQVPGLGRVLHAAFAGKDIRDAARRDGGAGDHHEHHADA